MKEGIKEALAKLNAARAEKSASGSTSGSIPTKASPKGPPTESGEAGTVRIGSEVKYLQEPADGRV